ncbi:MAG TPA: hypothetical protein VF060_19195 [Trebonia sp.]
MYEPPSRYNVTITVACEDGQRPDPVTFAAVASQAAWRRSASIVTAHTADTWLTWSSSAAAPRRSGQCVRQGRDRGSAAAVSGGVGHATQFFVAGLRSFLRFCFIESQVPVDLSQAAPPVTGRRRSPLPLGDHEG